VLRAVLFDLDGTLLDLDLDAFLKRYFAAVDHAASPSFPGVEILPAILGSTRAMHGAHVGRTNRDVFFEEFLRRTGVDLEDSWGVFGDFYRDTFPTLGDSTRPAIGARQTVETARRLGLSVAVATQPIFPLQAIEHRLRWAGLDDVEFDVITTYEIMEACKPDPAYFLQTASMLGCAPEECLMVGDDRDADLPAHSVGMSTFYVGKDAAALADFRGDIADVALVLERLAGRGPAQGF
jgi:FMN phosphatase YigB (HAD superfamily)